MYKLISTCLIEDVGNDKVWSVLAHNLWVVARLERIEEPEIILDKAA